MSRLSFGPPWRFPLLLACIVALGGVAPATGAQQRSEPSQRRATQEKAPDPDERFAGEELPEDRAVPEGTATLLLAPSYLEIARGRAVTLSLSVMGARNLSGLPVTIHFDPTILEVKSVSLGSAWSDLSRPVLLYDASHPGDLVVGLAQMSSAATTVSGTAELVEIEFRALRPGTTRIYLDRYAVMEPGSRVQPATALTATITVR